MRATEVRRQCHNVTGFLQATLDMIRQMHLEEPVIVDFLD
jgi:hypothetical protein